MKSTRHIRIDVTIDEVQAPPEHGAEIVDPHIVMDAEPDRRIPQPGIPKRPERRRSTLSPDELRRRGWPDDRTYGTRIIAGEKLIRPEERIDKSGFLSTLQSLAVTIVMAVFAVTFLVQAFQVPSPSMEETLLAGDHLLVDKLRFGTDDGLGAWLPYKPVRRGDIIVFKWPVSPAQYFVKRVAGLPGDHVRLSDKRLLVNGTPVREKYVNHQRPFSDAFADNFPSVINGRMSSNVDPTWQREVRQYVRNGELVVPPGRYFVLGDNRDNSLDSRFWGFVPRENIVGRPLTIYWSANVSDPFLEHWRSRNRPNDKISRLMDQLVTFFQNARWERSLRAVR